MLSLRYRDMYDLYIYILHICYLYVIIKAKNDRLANLNETEYKYQKA